MKNLESRSSLVDTDKCVENIGSRFDLVLVASARSREISNISALLDVQEGRVGREYLKKVN